MNNLVTRLAVVACAAIGIAGCATTGTGSGAKAPELPAAAGGETTAAAARQTTNERGFIVKKLGELACFGDATKDCEGGVSFAIDKIEIDPECTEFGSRPDNGHTLLLHLRIATGDDADVVDRVGGVINPFSFVEIGTDGITRDTGIGFCADSSANQLPNTYGLNQKYQGVMELEVPEASGVIALQLSRLAEDGQRGWEWTYPA